MDALIEACTSKLPNQRHVDVFAVSHGLASSRLQTIIGSVMHEKGDVVYIDVGRNSLLGEAAMAIKLVLEEQHMMKMIFTPNGDKITIESFTRETLLQQIVNFEEKK
jgi:hypothetical protein